jgi:hypothetical protein
MVDIAGIATERPRTGRKRRMVDGAGIATERLKPPLGKP